MKNPMLIKKHVGYIQNEETRNAYYVMLGSAATMVNLECYPNPKDTGKLYFRYEMDSKEQPFAFIVNRKSLLFYIRLPAVRAKIYDFKGMQKIFNEIGENPRREWTIRIISTDDALKVIQHVLTKWQKKYC